MNKKIMIKKITIVVIVLGLSSLIGGTYAYFNAKIKGSENETTLTAESGEMRIDYEGGPNITAEKIVPSNYPVATKEFTVTGTNTTEEAVGMIYYLDLVVDTNTFTSNSIGYKLLSTNTDNNGEIVPSTNLITIETGASTNALGIGTFTSVSQGQVRKHSYRLEIYFPETNETDNSNLNKSFKMHIAIDDDITLETQVKTTEELVTIGATGSFDMGTKVKGIKSITVDNGTIKNISVTGNKINYEIEGGNLLSGETPKTCTGAATSTSATQNCASYSCPYGGTLSGSVCGGTFNAPASYGFPGHPGFSVACYINSGCSISSYGGNPVPAINCPLPVAVVPGAVTFNFTAATMCSQWNCVEGVGCGGTCAIVSGTCTNNSWSSMQATCVGPTYSCSGGATLSGTTCYSCAQGTLSGTTCSWNCPEPYSYYQYQLTIEYYI